MTGKWLRSGEELTMIEQGLSYRTEILKLTAGEFRIRSYNPGDPVEIGMVRVE